MGICAILHPIGAGFEFLYAAAPRETDGAGKKAGFGQVITGAVFVIAHQREATAGELNADLMGASGMEADSHQTGFSGAKGSEFQSRGLNTGPLPFDHENLILCAVLP